MALINWNGLIFDPKEVSGISVPTTKVIGMTVWLYFNIEMKNGCLHEYTSHWDISTRHDDMEKIKKYRNDLLKVITSS